MAGVALEAPPVKHGCGGAEYRTSASPWSVTRFNQLTDSFHVASQLSGVAPFRHIACVSPLWQRAMSLTCLRGSRRALGGIARPVLKPAVALPCASRRTKASLAQDGQQQVRSRRRGSPLLYGGALDMLTSLPQLLVAHLQQADPAVFDIIENVCPSRYKSRGSRLTERRPGEKTTEAFHQPDPVRELYFPGCSRCPR